MGFILRLGYHQQYMSIAQHDYICIRNSTVSGCHIRRLNVFEGAETGRSFIVRFVHLYLFVFPSVTGKVSHHGVIDRLIQTAVPVHEHLGTFCFLQRIIVTIQYAFVRTYGQRRLSPRFSIRTFKCIHHIAGRIENSPGTIIQVHGVSQVRTQEADGKHDFR